MTTLLTRKESARYLHISERTLARRVRDGTIPCISERPGARVLFRERDLEDYIKRNVRRR